MFENTLYTDFAGVLTAADNAVVYTSGDVSHINQHIIECTAGTIDIEVSVDGANYNATPVAVYLADDVTVGGGITRVVSIAVGKIGILDGKFRRIRIKQNGAVGSNCRGAHVWS